MGKYQTYRSDPESKKLYVIDNFLGGLNTEFSSDNSLDSEFDSLINFDIDKRGKLSKRKGFGELDALSQIFNLLEEQYLPDIKNKSDLNETPENTNDNLVYMKLLQNDNKCFRGLSAFNGEHAYRDYQKLYGFQNNIFKLLLITTNMSGENDVSTAWLYTCTLPELNYNELNEVVDTISITCTKTTLPIVFSWDRNLVNPETIEFFNKIYITNNNKGLVCFDRETDTFSYSGFSINELVNNAAYKPRGIEIRKIGFNVLGDNPLYYIDYQNISTDSIQGIYLTSEDNIPLLKVPFGTKFRLNANQDYIMIGGVGLYELDMT